MTAIELVKRAVDEGFGILKPQLERMISNDPGVNKMAQSAPKSTKRSGNGSKRKGTKKLKTLAKR